MVGSVLLDILPNLESKDEEADLKKHRKISAIIAKTSDAKICSQLSKKIVQTGNEVINFENDYDHPDVLYIINDNIDEAKNIARSYGVDIIVKLSKKSTEIEFSDGSLDIFDICDIEKLAKNIISLAINWDKEEKITIPRLKNTNPKIVFGENILSNKIIANLEHNDFLRKKWAEELIASEKIKVDLFILGGAGPAASAEFFDKILEKKTNLSIIHLSLSQCPSKYGYICNHGPSFVPYYKNIVSFANLVNARLMVTPCNTNHAVMFKDLDGGEGWSNSFKGKIIDYRETLSSELKNRNIEKVLILGTNVTTTICKLYHESLENFGIEPKTANQEGEEKIMNAILKIKAGKFNEAKKLINSVIRKVRKDGDIVVVLACTELPLVYSKQEIKKKNLICVSSTAIKKILED